MELSLKTIGKGLMVIGLVSLIFRVGNFYNSFIPKPYEIIFLLLGIITAVDLLKNKKIKEFWDTIPKKIWIAIITMIFAVVFGWMIAFFLKGIPFSFNALLEFGTFGFSIGTFVFVLYYSNNDPIIRKLFYALLISVIYIILIISPKTAGYFHLMSDSNFLGFTTNPNVASKIVLIPTLYFITYALYEVKNKWSKIGYIAISSMLVALIFWTASRGALFSLVIGMVVVGGIVSLHEFKWSKVFQNSVIILLIMVSGFIMTPYTGKQVVTNRLLNLENSQSTYSVLKDKSVTDIIQESAIKSSQENSSKNIVPGETRFQIWPYYLKQILHNPFGIGPNTHLDSYIPSQHGGYLNTGPHNTYLQIWLWGGLLGLFSFLYILLEAFKNLKKKIQTKFDPLIIALLGMLATLSLSIVFDDSLSLYCFWAVLAISLKI